MARAERLLETIALLRRHRRVTLEELSHRFRVSERTIYRDLRALNALRIPVRHENGYCLESSRLFGADLTPEETVLLDHVLRHSGLARWRFFRRRLMELRRKLLSASAAADNGGTPVFRCAGFSVGRPPKPTRLDEWLETFVNACRQRATVEVRTVSGGRTVGRAREVRLDSAGPGLVIEQEGRRLVIRLVSVADLKVSE